MLSLKDYLIQECRIFEGGASGHMAHPFDYTEFTLDDIVELIENLFSGNIEDITEKVDGTNIQATVNKAGEVVFIRNKGDLNSEKGGMSISDMASKWADKPSVAKTFITAGETITKVFQDIPNKFFNPDDNTRVIVNCECVIAGKTNIIPYADAQVDFHNLWIYKYDGSQWIKDEVTKSGLDTIEKACENVDSAQVTPQLIIKITSESEKLKTKFIKEITHIFKDEKLGPQDTIEMWKKNGFHNLCESGISWILTSDEGFDILFDRWFNGVKAINIRKIKQLYPDYSNELDNADKGEYKGWVESVMEPLDTFFLNLGNSIISLCDGIINQGHESDIITTLRNDLDDITKEIERSGSDQIKDKLTKQLVRLERLGNNINPTEGIVFKYKDKLMKLTGSFAPLNQILGSIKFSVA